VLLEIPPASGEQVISLAQAWEEIERVIPREELTAAVEQLGELVPDDDGDDAEWRQELVKRYGSVTGFLGLLAQIQLGAVDVRQPVLAAICGRPEPVGRRRVLADELDQTLVTGSWRRLVLANPGLTGRYTRTRPLCHRLYGRLFLTVCEEGEGDGEFAACDAAFVYFAAEDAEGVGGLVGGEEGAGGVD
jgi:hypothetical protein